MRSAASCRFVAVLLLGGLLISGWLSERPAQAGGPLIVGAGSAGFGADGIPYTWDLSANSALVAGGQIQYRTDGGSLGVRDNQTANNSVAAMFDKWENIATSNVAFNRAGALQNVSPNFTDGDVSTPTEFNAVEGSCNSVQQNPIIYDANGSLFQGLGFSAGVIGFAGACAITVSSSSPGRIVSAHAALNGKFIDGVNDPLAGNFELTPSQFNGAFIHEFGHFFGLDHSQINLNCDFTPASCPNGSDDIFGVPTMYPFLLDQEESSGVSYAETLSTDDVAWVSKLYPGPGFSSGFGTITGSILFSDGSTPAQGVNVIARQVDNPATPQNESRRIAVSVVSGFSFTGNPGQTVTANYLPCSPPPPPGCPSSGFAGNNSSGDRFGSRNTALLGSYEIPGLPPGNYTVEVESLNPAATGGSGIGPLDPPIPSPGPNEFFNLAESATDLPGDASQVALSAGGAFANANVILNGTPPALDALEPDDSRGSAAGISNGITSSLSNSPFGNPDFYSFSAIANSVVTVEIIAQRAPVLSPMDSVIEIVDGNGDRPQTCRDAGDDSVPPPIIPDSTPSAFDDSCINDDIVLGVINDSKLEFLPSSSGTFFLHVLDFRGDGRPDLQYQISLTGTPNPLPTLSLLSPASATAGAPGFALTVNGSGFVNDSIVRWKGVDRATTFINSTQLQAFIPASDLAAGDVAQVTVFNPAPSGGTSNSLDFTVSNPLPVVAALLPDAIPATSSSFTLRVRGSGFNPGSVVRWKNLDRTTSVDANGDLLAMIPASDVATPGTAKVTVFNPAPGGGTSNALTFTIILRNPLPTITSLSPPGVLEDGPGFTLTVSGSNFVFSSEVNWNGSPRTTTFMSGRQLQAAIPANEVMSPGAAVVTVVSPGPGGGISNAANFTVQSMPNLLPTIDSLNPNIEVAGANRTGIALEVDGTDFINGSVVRWNGMDRVTMFISNTQLQATIPASDLAAGTAQVTVFTPGPGGGTSNPQTFTINNPVSSLSSLSPGTGVAGSAGFTLVAVGANFVPGSVVRWNGSPRVTTYLGNSQLRAPILASDIAVAGMAQVTVSTPGPGGGTSNALSFNVTMSSSSASNGTAATPSSASRPQKTEAPGSSSTAEAKPSTPVGESESRLAVSWVNPGLGEALEPPRPEIESLSPATVAAGSAGFTLIVRGRNFLLGAVIRWNGKEKTTTRISSTELHATVSAGEIAVAGSAKITVYHPTSGSESESLSVLIPRP